MSDELTIATYEAAAARYRELANPIAMPAVLDLLDLVQAALPIGGSALELGSGPGAGALLLEARGFVVRRTDGASSFVGMLRSEGHAADVLDVRTGDLGGPYDVVVALAVFLHLDRGELADLLRRLREVTGAVAFTVKEGDGEAVTTDRLDLPRLFTYWREQPLRDLLTDAGWTVRSLTRATAREPWLLVFAD